METAILALFAEQMPFFPARPIVVELIDKGYRVVAGVDHFEAQRASGAELIWVYEADSAYAEALLCDLDSIYKRLDDGFMTIVERAECLAEHERIQALLCPELEYQAMLLKQ